MAKFNVGDRVIRNGNGDGGIVKPGTMGVIREVFDECVSVKWENGSIYPYLVRNDYVSVAEPAPEALTLDAAIALYQVACERFEAAQLNVERAKADIADAKLAIGAALEGE